MPRKDLYHDVVVKALESEGWLITDDPLHLSYGGRNLYVDLGAEEQTIGAERNEEKNRGRNQKFFGRFRCA